MFLTSYATFQNEILSASYNTYSTLPLDQWINIVIVEEASENESHIFIPTHLNHQPRHTKYYVIKNLLPATNYEARVQARNDFGWNKLSSIFHFSTRAEGKANSYILPCSHLNLI